MKETDLRKGIHCTPSGTLCVLCSAAGKDSQPNHAYWFFFPSCYFSVVTSSSTHALSPGNDCADPRVRQNSKQREEELELIEQLRKVSAYRKQCVDVLVNAFIACHHVKAALVFWTDFSEPFMARGWPKWNGTVQSECSFQTDAVVVALLWGNKVSLIALEYTVLTITFEQPMISAFKINMYFLPYHPSHLLGSLESSHNVFLWISF